MPLNCQQKATATCPQNYTNWSHDLLSYHCSEMDGMGSPEGMMEHSMMDLKGGMGSPYSCYSSPKLPYDSFANRGEPILIPPRKSSDQLIFSSRWVEPEPYEDRVSVASLEPARRLQLRLRPVSSLRTPLLPLAHWSRPMSQLKFILRSIFWQFRVPLIRIAIVVNLRS